MNACSEATAHILNLTHQVAQMKQMTTTEQIQRGQIIDAGAEILNAWYNGQPYSKELHAKWAEASDPKTLEKKLKAIAKEFEAKEKEERAKLMMTPEEKAIEQKKQEADAINADTKLQKAKHNQEKHETKVVDDKAKQAEREAKAKEKAKDK